MFKLQVNIPDDLLKEIDKVAEQKYLNRTSMVTLLLAEGVQRCKSTNSISNMSDSVQAFTNLISEELKKEKEV